MQITGFEGHTICKNGLSSTDDNMLNETHDEFHNCEKQQTTDVKDPTKNKNISSSPCESGILKAEVKDPSDCPNEIQSFTDEKEFEDDKNLGSLPDPKFPKTEVKEPNHMDRDSKSSENEEKVQKTKTQQLDNSEKESNALTEDKKLENTELLDSTIFENDGISSINVKELQKAEILESNNIENKTVSSTHDQKVVKTDVKASNECDIKDLVKEGYKDNSIHKMGSNTTESLPSSGLKKENSGPICSEPSLKNNDSATNQNQLQNGKDTTGTRDKQEVSSKSSNGGMEMKKEIKEESKSKAIENMKQNLISSKISDNEHKVTIYK